MNPMEVYELLFNEGDETEVVELGRLLGNDIDINTVNANHVWYVHVSNGKPILDVEEDEKLFMEKYRNYTVKSYHFNDIVKNLHIL